MKTSNKLLPKAETFEISPRYSNLHPNRTDRVQYPKIDFKYLIVLFLSFSLSMLMPTNTYADNNECGVDVNNFLNNRGSKKNFHPNIGAFAALKADGSITAWGNTSFGGSGAPTDSGYVSIASTYSAFAALKADGSITAWRNTSFGGSGAPTDSGYVSIASTGSAFAALKADGSITAWGDTRYGGSGAPTDSGYVSIASTGSAFAALKADGSITAWGDTRYGGSGAPTDSGYVSIASSSSALSVGGAFAALKADGSITAWGDTSSGGSGAPTDSGYVSITSEEDTFAALKADGSITAWGNTSFGGSGAPTDSGYVSIASTYSAFAALKADGSITAWGDPTYGGSGAPTDSGYVSIASTSFAFAALKADGSITAWGNTRYGGSGAPTDLGYVSIASMGSAFAALKADGSITAWGDTGSSGALTDSGYVSIASTGSAFAALKADGSITAWGDTRYGGSGAPTDSGYVSINGVGPNTPKDCSFKRIDSNLDSDSDGMPDWYEDKYGLNKNDPADALLDKDGDGLTNKQEFLLATNPTDPATQSGFLNVAPTTPLDFGSVVIGQISSNQNISVANTGNALLSFTCATTPPFNLTFGNCAFDLAPNEFADLAVNFSPTAEGAFNGTVNFSSNGGNASRSVTGIGTLTPPPQPGNVPFWSEVQIFGGLIASDQMPEARSWLITAFRARSGDIAATQNFQCNSGKLVPSVCSGDAGYANYGPKTKAAADKLFADKVTGAKKILPNGWAVRVTDTVMADGMPLITTDDGVGNNRYRWYKVQDMTDGTTGWMVAGKVDTAGKFLEVYLPNMQIDLKPKADPSTYQDIDKRKQLITEAVNHYFTNTSSQPSLYSSNDITNLSALTGWGFIPEVILAIAAQESCCTLDNEIISRDYGHGIMQPTLQPRWAKPYDNRGVYSMISIPACALEDNAYQSCYNLNDFVTPKTYKQQPDDQTTFKYYVNSLQSIYANIKDGIGILKDKYGSYASAYQTNKVWTGLPYKGTNYDISLADMRKAVAIKGYNGFGGTAQCYRLNTIENKGDPNYLDHVGEKLQNINSQNNFPSASLSPEASRFGTLLRVAHANKASVSICSPGVLRVIDADGNITGITSNTLSHEIPNAAYDDDNYKAAEVYAVDNTYKYQVIGTEAGTYSFYIDNTVDAATTTIELHNVPLALGEIYTFQVAWDAIARGEKGLSIKIDRKGDGTDVDTITVSANVNDTQPPVTSHAINGTSGLNGWYTSDVTVSLSGTDGSGVGVKATSYSLDNGPWQTYNSVSSVVIATEGIHTLQYYSTDFFGNKEETRTLTLKIDKTAPTINILAPATGTDYVLQTAQNASYTCADATSDVASCSGPVASGSAFDTATDGSKVFTVTARDQAGNTAVATSTYRVINQSNTLKVTQLLINKKLKSFFLLSNFTLGTGSNGLNPLKEAVTFKIGNFTSTIPANSFRKVTTALFAYAGTINKVKMEVTITSLGNNRYAFQTAGIGVNFSTFTNPATVNLSIGDDNGTTSAQGIIK